MKKHKVSKTIAQINQKIKSGDVVVVTSEEIIDIVKKDGLRRATYDACQRIVATLTYPNASDQDDKPVKSDK